MLLLLLLLLGPAPPLPLPHRPAATAVPPPPASHAPRSCTKVEPGCVGFGNELQVAAGSAYLFHLSPQVGSASPPACLPAWQVWRVLPPLPCPAPPRPASTPLQMTGALVAVCSVLVVVAAVFGGFSRRAQRTYQDKLAASNEVAEESFKLARLIRYMTLSNVGRHARSPARVVGAVPAPHSVGQCRGPHWGVPVPG